MKIGVGIMNEKNEIYITLDESNTFTQTDSKGKQLIDKKGNLCEVSSHQLIDVLSTYKGNYDSVDIGRDVDNKITRYSFFSKYREDGSTIMKNLFFFASNDSLVFQAMKDQVEEIAKEINDSQKKENQDQITFDSLKEMGLVESSNISSKEETPIVEEDTTSNTKNPKIDLKKAIIIGGVVLSVSAFAFTLGSDINLNQNNNHQYNNKKAIISFYDEEVKTNNDDYVLPELSEEVKVEQQQYKEAVKESENKIKEAIENNETLDYIVDPSSNDFKASVR
jgi:hypothetical protein